MTACTWCLEILVFVSKGQQTENLSVATLLLKLRYITGHGPGQARKYFVV